ncbi:hypothetical protein MTO96_023029 [Rhipicephalus appendiculatus]
MHPGAFRGASKAGAFVTLLAFFDIYAKHDLLTSDNKYEGIAVRREVGGYTVNVECVLKKDKSVVEIFFTVHVCDGEWSEYVEWPFSKKITLIITHLRNQKKDIRVPLRYDYSEPHHIRKPARGTCNSFMNSKYVNWADIELNGFVANKTLFVNIELE